MTGRVYLIVVGHLQNVDALRRRNEASRRVAHQRQKRHEGKLSGKGATDIINPFRREGGNHSKASTGEAHKRTTLAECECSFDTPVRTCPHGKRPSAIFQIEFF